MGGEVTTNKEENMEDLSPHSISIIKKINQCYGDEANNGSNLAPSPAPTSHEYYGNKVKNGSNLALSPAPTSRLQPITPDPDRENGGYLRDFTSQLKLASLPLRSLHYGSHRNSDLNSSSEESPCTPKECIFDPLASCQESRKNVVRSLEFIVQHGSNEFSSGSVDEDTFQNVRDAVLDDVGWELAEELPNKVSDCFGSPTTPYLLTGIAEPCPGAPRKPVGKPRIIDKRLCRKLEF